MSVSGEFQRAPSTLDFRDANNPRRIENRTALPGPWLDRVSATFAAARQFDGLGQLRDAGRARSEAAGLYDEMLRMDTDRFGPPLAPLVIEALAAMGVDFSVPDNELRDWLANPEFTPYPSTAQALLRLGGTLKAPVFLDVISFNYDNTPGVTSPRTVDQVREDVLRAAVVEGWNVRYDDHLSAADFELLLAG